MIREHMVLVKRDGTVVRRSPSKVFANELGSVLSPGGDWQASIPSDEWIRRKPWSGPKRRTRYEALEDLLDELNGTSFDRWRDDRG